MMIFWYNSNVSWTQTWQIAAVYVFKKAMKNEAAFYFVNSRLKLKTCPIYLRSYILTLGYYVSQGIHWHFS